MAEKRVSVRLVAEGGNQVRSEFKGIGDAGETGFKRVERQADITGAVVRRVMGILGTVISTRQLIAYADTWTDLRSRVDLATGSQEAGAAVMERIAAMARRTYSGLEQTAESWLANATALRELGMSTTESLDFTEALNNAMVVSGARAERATQIQNALAQAMALGELRGQQLNTVIMNGGRLAELLADEMGVNVNQLRALGAQGEITGDVIRRALLGNLELLREEADNMPATIGDGFTLIGNAALQLVGRWDQMAGASASVADVLIMVADNMERLAAIAISFGAVMAGRWVSSFIRARASTIGLSSALGLLRGAIIRTGIGALIVGAGELIYWFGRLVQGAGGFGEAMRLLGNLGKAVWQELRQGGDALLHGLRGIASAIDEAFLNAFANIMENFKALVDWLTGVGAINKLLEWTDSDFRLPSLADAAVEPLRDAARRSGEDAAAHFANARDVFADMPKTQAAIEELRAALEAMGSEIDDGSDAAARLAEILDDIETSAKGAGAAGSQAGNDLVFAAHQAATGWEAVRQTLADYANRALEIGADIGRSLVGAFRGAENAIGEFVRTGKLKFTDLVTSMIADLARLAARRFILGPIANALSGALGGIGSGFGSGSNIFPPAPAPLGVGLYHDGGIAGAPRSYRMMPALAFAGAQRMHSGGWAGLRPDEVPAILQRGERVLSRREARDYGNGGNVTIHILARDVESFRQSRTQVAADIARAVSLGRRGL